MRAPPPKWLGPGIATAVSVAVAGDRIWLGWRARSAEVSHLLSAPPLWLWIPALVLALAALPIALSLAARRGDRFARVPLLVAVVVVFVELFVTPAVEPPGGAGTSEILVRGAAAMIESQLADPERLPQTTEELSAALEQLAAPPYLIRGIRPAAWKLRLQSHCTGPALSADGASAGTLLYCLSPDGKRAWITAVGLASATFGRPELLRVGDKPAVGVVDTPGAAPPKN